MVLDVRKRSCGLNIIKNFCKTIRNLPDRTDRHCYACNRYIMSHMTHAHTTVIQVLYYTVFVLLLLLLPLFVILIVIGQVPVLYDTIIVWWLMILREKSDLPSSVGQCSRRVHYYIRPQDYIIYNQFENATVAAAVAIIIGVGTVHACLAEN